MSLPPLAAIPPDLRSLADYEQRARAHMDEAVWHHIEEGAGAGHTLRANRAEFDRIGLLPRAMADLRGGNTRISLLGRTLAAPILLAPVAYQALAHPDGELASVQAAMAMDTPMVVSTLASARIEAIAATARAATQTLGRGAPLWFQLYLQPDRADSLRLIRRAEAAGYEAIVLTIDAAIKLAGMTLPRGVEAVNLAGMPRPVHTAGTSGRIVLGTPLADAAPCWDDLTWLRSVTDLPVLVKGLVLGEDAKQAIALGADGLILSNHGGRVLDGLPPTLALLPDLVAVVAGRVPILLDSGVRTGTDCAKALALGASAVLIGRPQYHALAVAGVAGMAHLLLILRTELEMAMAQMGCPTIPDLTPARLWRPHSQYSR